MKFTKLLILAAASSAILFASAPKSEAFISLLVMADRMVQEDAKKALNTPGHAAWCAKQAPGYRKEWNNWRTPNGRVKYCASPYHTPLWLRGRQ